VSTFALIYVPVSPVVQSILVSSVVNFYAPVSHIEQKVLVNCCLAICSSFPYRAESSCQLLPCSIFQFPIESRKFLSPVALLYVPVSHIEQKVLVNCCLAICSSFPCSAKHSCVICCQLLCSSFPYRAESSCHLWPCSMLQFPIWSRKFLSPVALL